MKPVDKLQFWLKVAIGVVFLAYIINFAYAVWSGQKGGTFGDTFGATNALFSGVALMMLIYAVILQREELAVIKEERDDTRKLLSGQEKITALQEEALRKQIFEQSFNAMLKVVMDEKANLSIETGTNGKSKTALRESVYSATSFILEKTKVAVRMTYSQPKIFAPYFLINAILRLDQLIDSAPDLETKISLQSLVSSILDTDICVCIAMYILERRLFDTKTVNFEPFAEKYDIEAFLSEAPAIFFEQENILSVFQSRMKLQIDPDK
jgi:hypothetical protein